MMDYNPLPDLIVFGALLGTLALMIWCKPKRRRWPRVAPLARVHMVDQKARVENGQR